LKTSGNPALSSITSGAIKHGIDRRKPFAARHFLDTMRGLFKWAVDAEHVAADPTAGKTAPKSKTKGFPVWDEDEMIQVEERWPRGTRERVAFDLLLYTGLRRGDAVVFGRPHVRTVSVV
jgi:site-specific recombinase XerC